MIERTCFQRAHDLQPTERLAEQSNTSRTHQARKNRAPRLRIACMTILHQEQMHTAQNDRCLIDLLRCEHIPCHRALGPSEQSHNVCIAIGQFIIKNHLRMITRSIIHVEQSFMQLLRRNKHHARTAKSKCQRIDRSKSTSIPQIGMAQKLLQIREKP